MRRNGYTLIELVVVAGLVGLLSLGLVNMFTSSVRGSQRARLQAEVKSQGDFAIASMERQIRNATALPTPNENYTALSFETSGTDGTQIYSFDAVNETINFQGQSLFSPPVTVTSATFTPKLGAGSSLGSVEIKFTLRGLSGNLVVDQPFQTTVTLRNMN